MEKNDIEDTDITDEEEEVIDEPIQPTEDADALKARIAKLEEKAIAQRERTKLLRQELSKASKQKEAPQKKEHTGDLDESQLDYLDLKGISDSDEIDIISKVVAKTGQTVRQALQDDYVVGKLEKLRADKAVKDATPSSTRRGGNQTNDLAVALARFDATGELPDDFELRSAVVNAKYQKSSTNRPSWQK